MVNGKRPEEESLHNTVIPYIVQIITANIPYMRNRVNTHFTQSTLILEAAETYGSVALIILLI